MNRRNLLGSLTLGVLFANAGETLATRLKRGGFKVGYIPGKKHMGSCVLDANGEVAKMHIRVNGTITLGRLDEHRVFLGDHIEVVPA